MNEGLGNTISWQYHFLNFVRNVEASLPKRHLVGMTGGDFPNHHLFKSPADWISPIESDSNHPYSDNPSATDASKVSLLDTDRAFTITPAAMSDNAVGPTQNGYGAASREVTRRFTSIQWISLNPMGSIQGINTKLRKFFQRGPRWAIRSIMRRR